MHFADDLLGHGRVVNDAEAVNVVDAGIGKRQAFFGVCHLEAPRYAEQHEAFAGELDTVRSEIGPDVDGAAACELEAVSGDPAANL